jgi:hypothetical protein
VNDVTAAQVLDLWERAATVSPVARPVALLGDGAVAGDLEREPLGIRDKRLSALRERLRGSDVEGLARCPGCGDEVEVHFDLRDVFTDGDVRPTVDVSIDDWQFTCRPLNTADLVSIADRSDAEDALLACAVTSAVHRGRPASVADAPAPARAAIDAAVADADPLADVVLALSCPACDHEWRAPLDLAAFLWDEIDHTARELLRDVDELARAYGWREPDVLALSSWRRRRYLEMVRG